MPLDRGEESRGIDASQAEDRVDRAFHGVGHGP